jgi:hypothetical protein
MSDEEGQTGTKRDTESAGPEDEHDVHITALLGDDQPAAAAQIWLGTLAAMCLRGAAIVTFCLDKEGYVRWADPNHVYLDHRAVLERDENRKVRFVSPILNDGTPPYVGIKDGQLWVVEFEDEDEPEETAGG